MIFENMRKYVYTVGIVMLTLLLVPSRAYICYGSEMPEAASANGMYIQSAEAEEAVTACRENLDALESHKKAVKKAQEETAEKRADKKKTDGGNTEETAKNTANTDKDAKSEKKAEKEDSPALEMIGAYKLPRKLKTRLNTLISETEKEGNHIGLVMIDIRTAGGIAYNAEQSFYSASTVKGPFMVSLAARDPESAQKEEKTMAAIARTSDNNLYSGLFKKYGTSNYKLWCAKAGVDPAFTKAQYTDYTAEDLARLWLMNFAYFSSGKENAATAGSWFEDPNQSPVHKVLKRVYTTRTKAGWISQNLKASADAGIVYAGDSPYVVAILSDYGDRLPKLEPYVHLLEEIHADLSGSESVLLAVEREEKEAKELAEKAKAEKEAAEKAQKEAEEQAAKAKSDQEAAEKAQKEAEEKAEKAKEEIRAAKEALKEAEEAAEKAKNEKEAAEQMQKEAEEKAEEAKAGKESAERAQKEAEEQAAALGGAE